MGAKEDIKILIFKEGTTIKAVAEKLSEKNGAEITSNSISQKLRKGTLRYDEAAEIADVLGYKLEFVRKTN